MTRIISSRQVGTPFATAIACGVVFAGGACALAWQLLWQIEIALAIGASVRAAAITVAVTMGGLAIGATSSPRVLEKALKRFSALTVLGGLEVAIAFLAAMPVWLSPRLQELDTLTFQAVPAFADVIHVLMLGLVLGPSTVLMGATVPLFGRLVESFPSTHRVISTLYAVNTLGAVVMVGVVAFLLLPYLGRAETAGVVWLIHLLAGVVALSGGFRHSPEVSAGGLDGSDGVHPPGPVALNLALISGMVILALEVIWFRLLKIAWLSTTDAFAVMLMVFLLALFLGARLGRWKPVRNNPALFLFLGIVLALLMTPVLERFDGWFVSGGAYGLRVATRLFGAMVVMGPPVVLMATCLPVLLDRAGNLRAWGTLYGANTIGAVIGSLGAAWVLFPALGPVASAWVVLFFPGVVALIVAASVAQRRSLFGWAVLFSALAVSIYFSTWIGVSRAAGPTAILRGEHEVVAHRDSPDASTSVVSIEPNGENAEPYRLLFIDGYAASGEFGPFTHYMVEMGRIPVRLHPDPARALVICYGTGQTANAVRNHGAKEIDIVDINPAVFELSDFFPSNEDVLEDGRVNHAVMDGRAWLRRTTHRYEVVTLEPMPPFFAGSNALYSVEFYEGIESRLHEGGVVAQWFPMHLMSTAHARSVAAAFLKVFPTAVLWIDPVNRDHAGVPQQGILLGMKGEPATLMSRFGNAFPPEIALLPAGLQTFCEGVEPVTDDNQLLSYGREGMHRFDLSRHRFAAETYGAVQEAAGAPP